ncbi:MAG TPA: IclR family transcriptional regulator [Firmicutes bacterium]|nr:IclR family transcriptional regulator [Bacillota bacterium]
MELISLEGDSKNTVQSVKRAMLLLEQISFVKEIGIRDLSNQSGLKRSTVQRLVSTLEKAGFLFQNQNTRKYRLSFKLYQIGNRAIQQIDMVSVTRPILKKLMLEIQETVVLGIIDEGDLVYIDKLSFPQEFYLTTTIGSRVPAYCTGTGKAILAHLPKEERLHILSQRKLHAFTCNTITDIDRLENEFAEIRKRGYSIDHEERFSGIVSIAAPFWDYRGKVWGAVGVPGFTHRIIPERIPSIGKVVLRVSKEISNYLGHTFEK